MRSPAYRDAVIVIGLGGMGSSVAAELARRGRRAWGWTVTAPYMTRVRAMARAG